MTNNPNYDLNDPELALKTFFGKDGSIKSPNNHPNNEEVEKYMSVIENVRTASVRPGITPFKTKEQLKSEANVRRIKAAAGTLLVLSSLLAAKHWIAKAKEDTEIRGFTSSISQTLADNKQSGGINPNTQTPYWWYSPYLMEAIKADQRYDNDLKIYSYFLYLKGEYNGMNQLDEIIAQTTEFDSFYDYLVKNGYSLEPEKIAEWKNNMDKKAAEPEGLKNWKTDMRNRVKEELAEQAEMENENGGRKNG